jgi:tetrahydromethanopterin S-methyltransferase subunit F
MPFHLDRNVRGGHAKPAPPSEQSFWVDKASGSSKASIDWKVDDGRYRAVIMNGDGSMDVATHGTFGVTVPRVSAIALGGLIAGLILSIGGLVTLVSGARRVRPQ